MNDPWTWTTVWGWTVGAEDGLGRGGQRGEIWDKPCTACPPPPVPSPSGTLCLTPFSLCHPLLSSQHISVLVWLKKKALSCVFFFFALAFIIMLAPTYKYEWKRMRSFSSCRGPPFPPVVSPSHSRDCKTWQFPFTASNDLEFCFAFQFCLNPYGKVKTPNKSDKFHLMLATSYGLVSTVSFALLNSTFFHDHLYLHLQTWTDLAGACETRYKRAHSIFIC